MTGPIGVCLGAGTGHVFGRGESGWVDVTSSPACGMTDALGSFARFVDPSPPVLVPHLRGPLGDNGWYVGDVTVSWDVADPQTPATAESGCAATTVSADTAGTTLTCTATSEGGTATDSVTVKRDATPPTVACTPTPSVLWPPNGKLVPVHVRVVVDDATSGAASFLLTDAPTVDTADFSLGTPDIDGLLRARRPGDGGDRTYTLTYIGRDAAGNTSECETVVVVPHDKGG